MPRKQVFLNAEWSEQWKASYAKLSSDRQAACDETAIVLIKQTSSSGLRIKPIQPESITWKLESTVEIGSSFGWRRGRSSSSISFSTMTFHVMASV
ncbi:MAG TPA: hypothetical protein VKM72_32125 [Thermoanaerobaculia bacterium]|nr:hypothetical protein [Thermoanaerobaculia bacterium]